MCEELLHSLRSSLADVMCEEFRHSLRDSLADGSNAHPRDSDVLHRRMIGMVAMSVGTVGVYCADTKY